MKISIVRVPLVYGPYVKGNFLQLLKLVAGEKILPIGCGQNKRTFLYVGNLVNFIAHGIESGNGGLRPFLVSDKISYSTLELSRFIANAMGTSPKFLRVPIGPMRFAARLMGKKDAFDRLFSNLELDNAATRCELNWEPPFSTKEGIRLTTEWFNQIYRK